MIAFERVGSPGKTVWGGGGAGEGGGEGSEAAGAGAAADDGVSAVAKREQQPPLPRGGSRPAENASYRRATCACAPLPRSLPLAAGANLTV